MAKARERRPVGVKAGMRAAHSTKGRALTRSDRRPVTAARIKKSTTPPPEPILEPKAKAVPVKKKAPAKKKAAA